MMQRTYFCLMFLCVMSVSGFAQINKHSFGASINNGIILVPEENRGVNAITGEDMINPAHAIYLFGIGGSYLNSTKKWLAWRTSMNFAVTSKYENYPESFDGMISRHYQRDFFVEIGFGPMFTYQKEDFGVYIGGAIDFMFFGSHEKGIPPSDRDIVRIAPFPIPTPSLYLGYWQRMGNVNSPWYFEVSLMRRVPRGIINLFGYESSPVMFSLNTGFRYEIK